MKTSFSVASLKARCPVSLTGEAEGKGAAQAPKPAPQNLQEFLETMPSPAPLSELGAARRPARPCGPSAGSPPPHSLGGAKGAAGQAMTSMRRRARAGGGVSHVGREGCAG